MTVLQVFVPFVSQGAARLIQAEDFSNGLKARATLDLSAKVRAGNSESTVNMQSVRLYGPGEAIGFDRLQVIRTEPKPFANDFEPNYFPFVEFDRPDFPWMLTPARATANGKLRPWIALVVVTNRALEIRPEAPLPVLKADASELPDLAESWLCAHAQVVLEGVLSAAAVGTALNGPADGSLSRLLCPRKLEPRTTYLACVVPAFDTGVKAGLGLPVPDGADLSDAWGPAGAVTLPVFYSWEFTTGAQGDFEGLARKIRAGSPDLQASFAGRPVSLANPGPGLPRVPDPAKAEDWPRLTGALMPVNGAAAPQPPQAFTNSLEKQLYAILPGKTGDLNPTLPLPPPLYGRWHAAWPKPGADPGEQPTWFCEVNTQPLDRIVAALGTQIVQENQEDLMAEAWRQYGEIERANRLLRQAQLARDAQNRVYAALFTREQRRATDPQLAPNQFTVTAPLFGHTRLQAGETAWGAVNQNASVGPAFDAAFRRLGRPRGPLGRRMTQGGRGFTDFAILVNRSGGVWTREPAAERKRGFTFEDVFGVLKKPVPDMRLCEWMRGIVADVKDPEPNDPRSAKKVWTALVEILCRSSAARFGQPEIDFKRIGKALVRELNPEQTVVKRVRGRIGNLPPEWKPADDLEPIMAAPEFPVPIFRKLMELSPEYVLPGVSGIPQNTVVALKPNRRFIEAVMVGANHEMGRELRWREFPTDQRGTYIHQFWDPAGRISRPSPEELKKAHDINPLHTWSKTARLGENGPDGQSADLTVLVVRAELFYRYPRTLVYMAKAAGQPGSRTLASPAVNEYPLYRGELPPDIIFIMFNISPGNARGQPGWFFVFQELPTEVRFGLDDPDPAAVLPANPTWADLTWADVNTRAGHIQWAKGPAGKRSAAFAALDLPGLPGMKWTAANPAPSLPLRSDHVAGLTRQQPFRIAIHADDLIPTVA